MSRVVALADAVPSRKDKTSSYLKGNLLVFGGHSYLHLFTLLVGVYMTTMMKATLRHLPAGLHTLRVARASEQIACAPSSFPAPTMQLQARPWMIVDREDGSANDASTPVRAFSKPSETVFRIPNSRK